MRLTDKQRRFVDAYVNNGGNGVEAIRTAGYNCGTDNSAGRRLDLAERRISSREDMAEFLTSVYLDDAFPINYRLLAVQLLGKMYGDYLERVVLQNDKVEMPVINICLENTEDES